MDDIPSSQMPDSSRSRGDNDRLDAQVQRVSPPGRSALAVVQLTGAGASTALARLFRPTPRRWRSRPYYGEFIGPSGDPIDDGMVLPRGDQSFLLTLHGNPLLVDDLLATFEGMGVRVVGEWEVALATPSSIERAAYRLLPTAPNAQAVGFLLEQAEEAIGLRRTVERWLREGAAAKELRQVVERAPAGRALFERKRVALVGEPNAGKSTLFNVLVGAERVVASPSAGTTRDVIEELCFVGDYPVLLADGAGLRESEDELEQEGMRRLREVFRLRKTAR